MSSNKQAVPECGYSVMGIGVIDRPPPLCHCASLSCLMLSSCCAQIRKESRTFCHFNWARNVHSRGQGSPSLTCSRLSDSRSQCFIDTSTSDEQRPLQTICRISLCSMDIWMVRHRFKGHPAAWLLELMETPTNTYGNRAVTKNQKGQRQATPIHDSPLQSPGWPLFLRIPL